LKDAAYGSIRNIRSEHPTAMRTAGVGTLEALRNGNPLEPNRRPEWLGAAPIAPQARAADS